MNAAEFARLIKKATRSGDQWSGCCPAHDDQSASLSFRDVEDRTLVNCHKGCSFKAIAAALGLKPRDFFHAIGGSPTAPAGPSTKRRAEAKAAADHQAIVKTYDYQDEQGSLLFQKVRTDPKGFFQRRPDGRGRWINDITGVRRVVYRLPEIIAAMAARPPGERVVAVVEGEKDCDTLWALGIPATTNSGGAGKWKDELTSQLVKAGTEAIHLFQDNDRAGEAHANDVAHSCLKAGLVVKDLRRLPGFPPLRDKHGEDVTDWLRDHTKEDLIRVMNAASEIAATKPATGRGAIASDPPASAHGQAAAPATAFHLTDLGNAERLFAQFGQDIRYADEIGWLGWDGQRWSRDNGAYEVMEDARLTVRGMYAEAATLTADSARLELVKHAKHSEAREKLEAMIALAKHQASAHLASFDTDPYLLTVTNGTVDLRTGLLQPHWREDWITKLAPVDYDVQAQAPTWHRFLKEIFKGNESLIRFLQRAVGYALTGLTSEQVLFILYGTGANGKSTFLKILGEIMGDYAMQTPTETLLVKREGSIPNDLARLVGVRFVTAVEISDGRRLDEALVKQVTGGDPITARFLRREFFQFVPAFKLFFAVNHKPQIRGTDHAIWRRIRLIPCEVTIPEDQQDRKLLEKLRGELPGVLAWAVRGCLEWQREGLRAPEEVRVATEAYRNDEDGLAQFLADCCRTGPSLRVKSADLYGAYTAWCERVGEHPVSQKKLGGQLTERGFIVRKSGGTKIWTGLDLADAARRGLHGDRGRHGDDGDHQALRSGSSQ